MKFIGYYIITTLALIGLLDFIIQMLSSGKFRLIYDTLTAIFGAK